MECETWNQRSFVVKFYLFYGFPAFRLNTLSLFGFILTWKQICLLFYLSLLTGESLCYFYPTTKFVKQKIVSNHMLTVGNKLASQ